MLKKAAGLALAFIMAMSVIGVSPTMAEKSATDIAYPVEGGSIYFDSATGTVTGYDGDITDVVIPEKINGVAVTSIGKHAFSDCATLTSVEIPNVTSIGEYAFSNCGSLISIEVGSDNETYSTEDGVLFNKDKTELIIYPAGKAKISPDYAVPESVTRAGDYAFSDCYSLESVTMPNVTSIGDFAFHSCESLENVSMPNVESIGFNAFTECVSLESVSMPSATSIGAWAFLYSSALSRVYLSKSLTSVGREAFNGCVSLKDVYYEGNEADRVNINIDNNIYDIPFYDSTGNDRLLNATWHYSSAMPTVSAQLTESQITVSVNGSLIDFDQAPIIENGRTLVPMRAIFEALGAKVEWNQEAQTATGEKDGVKISVTIGSDKMTVDGAEKTLDCPAQIVNGRTLVPARAIAEAFGSAVSWDNEARKVIIE